jgi:hypothetical protein
MDNAADNMGFWTLLGLLVYLVPLCVYLHQTRWLQRLVAPVLERLRSCPKWMLPVIGVFVVQMVVIGGWKQYGTMPDPYPDDLVAIDYPVAHPTNTWYVTTVGSDANAGTNWNCALATIQAAIDKAAPNAVVNVSAYEGTNVCVYAPIRTDNKKMLIQSVDRYGKHRKPVIRGNGLDTSAYLWDPESWFESRDSILKGFTVTKGTCGVYGGLAVDCVITGNTNWWEWGAGAYGAKLVNCLVYGNVGQGASGCTLVNCTIAHNYAEVDAALDTWCNAYNCIIWNNTNSMGRVSDISEYYPPVLTPNWMKLWGCHSDMVPWLSTETEYCADPKFVDPDNGDYHLSAESPCIDPWNSGYSVSGATTDLDGMQRLRGELVDVGCYEYVESPTIQTEEPVQVPYWWMWRNGLFAFDASPAEILTTATRDSLNRKCHGTFYKIWESYVADLDPTDSNQTFSVSIQLTNGVPEITFSPVSPRRRYELMGSRTPVGPWAVTNDFAAIDIRSTNNFFKARVSLP